MCLQFDIAFMFPEFSRSRDHSTARSQTMTLQSDAIYGYYATAILEAHPKRSTDMIVMYETWSRWNISPMKTAKHKNWLQAATNERSWAYMYRYHQI